MKQCVGQWRVIMRLNLLYLYLLVFCMQVFAKPNLSQPSPTEIIFLDVEEFCKTYSGQSDFLVEMTQKIIRKNNKRIELVKLMSQNKASGCRNAITDYLNQFLPEESDKVKQENFESVLLLAYLTKLPVAKKLIEKEIRQGKLMNWLDVFKQSDKDAYFQTLSQWVQKVAVLIRQLDHAEKVDSKYYGRLLGNEKDIKTPESIPSWNPMLINKYLDEVMARKEKLSIEGFGDLNIIFAASNQSYREIFISKMASIITPYQTNWILSFRSEPSWVQFRLFPVMSKIGGGLMKRELIWLSQNHQSFKVRSVAQTTLDKVNSYLDIGR